MSFFELVCFADSTTGNNFTCSCKNGFAGYLCDTPFCQIQECQNDAVCIINDENVSQPIYLFSMRTMKLDGEYL